MTGQEGPTSSVKRHMHAATALFEPHPPHAYAPTPAAAGPSGPGHVHGGAVAALLASRAMEAFGQDKFLTRLTLDLLRPVPAAPLEVNTVPLRDGRTFAGLQLTVLSGGAVVARGHAVACREKPTPLPAELQHEPAVPPREEGWPLREAVVHTSFNTDAVTLVVVDDPANRYGSTAWARLHLDLMGRTSARPEAVAMALADLTHGIGAVLPPDQYRWTNIDLTVTLARPPADDWIALRARTFPGPAGRGVAQSTLWDTDGPFGTVTQTLVITKETHVADPRP